MMALLIPGPKSPGKDFELFMEPLVEELQQLCKGVLTRDLYSSPPADFFLCAVIIWCIMIIRLWALCQGEQHMVTMHVFAVAGIRCHTQYLARSVTLDTVVSLPRTSLFGTSRFSFFALNTCIQYFLGCGLSLARKWRCPM